MFATNEENVPWAPSKCRTGSGPGGAEFLGVVASAVAADRLFMRTAAHAQNAGTTAVSLPIEGALPSLTGATAWINTAPLASADLRGKVVLVEFWTYTCINWLRSHAYIRAWAEKYKEHGLDVVGAHTPEFAFERELPNVRRAVQDPCKSSTRSRLIPTMRYGGRSTTTTGRHSTSSMRKAAFVITNSAKDPMRSRNASSNNS